MLLNLLAPILPFMMGIASACSLPPSLPPLRNFNLSAYQGEWFEIASTAEFKFRSEAGLVCVRAQYLPSSTNASLLTVTNFGIRILNEATSELVQGLASNVKESCRFASCAVKWTVTVPAVKFILFFHFFPEKEPEICPRKLDSSPECHWQPNTHSGHQAVYPVQKFDWIFEFNQGSFKRNQRDSRFNSTRAWKFESVD